MHRSLRVPRSMIVSSLLAFGVALTAGACQGSHPAARHKTRPVLDEPRARSEAEAVPTATAPADPVVAAAQGADEGAAPDAPPPMQGVALDTGPELHEVGGVGLRRLVVARDVRGREPVGVADRFASGQPLVAFLELSNTSDEDADVVVTFDRPDGTSVGHVQLSVPAQAPRWRTWARTHNAGTEGPWEAVVRTPDGALVGRTHFEVGSAGR